MRVARHLAAGVCLCLLACSSANIGDSSSAGPDGGGDPVDTGRAPDAGPQADAALQTTTLTQSQARNILALNSVSCNNGDPSFFHTDNSYYRVYDLAAANITSDFAVTSVDIAIEQATAASGTQSVSAFIYTLAAPPLSLANLLLIGSATVDIANQTDTILNIPVTGTAPAGSTLVVEFFTPNGQAVSNTVFVGSNNLGEGGSSFLRAGDCGVDEPTPIDQLGVAGLAMHIVLDVTGNHL